MKDSPQTTYDKTLFDRRLSELEKKLADLAAKIPSDEKLNGIGQGMMASVDAKIAQSEAKQKIDDSAQLAAVASMIQGVFTQLASYNEKVIGLLDRLSKPRKRSGSVQLPTGMVKMDITETLD